eukprot:162199_1
MSEALQQLKYVIWGFIRNEIENKYQCSIPSELKYSITDFAKYTIPSSMTTINEQFGFIHLLCNRLGQYIKWSEFHLLYRASENKFSQQKFHELCDNHSPTIIIIQSEFGHVFGGYTSVKWKSYGGYVTDPNAFLFIIRSKDKLQRCPYIFECKDGMSALNHNNPIQFGGGHDISIFEQFGYCCACSYKYKGNQLCGGNNKEDFLGLQCYRFHVIDFEVFEIVKDKHQFRCS